jgi:hypothetical protein
MTHTLRKHAWAMVLVAVLSGVVFALAAAPGQATEYPPDCDEGHLCLYDDDNWGKKVFDLRPPTFGLRWHVPSDRVTSWANRTSRTWIAINCRLLFCSLRFVLWVMPPRTSNRNVGDDPNDKADEVWRSGWWG